MNARMIPVGGLAALCIVCLVLSFGAPLVAVSGEKTLLEDTTLLQDSVPKTQAIGRYTIAASRDALYLCDTMTGEGWAKQGDSWMQIVKPLGYVAH
jgi:hypothetical protein